MVVNAQAILTQVVFDHAMRIRMKAETSSEHLSKPDVSTSIGTSETIPVVENRVPQTDTNDSSSASVSKSLKKGKHIPVEDLLNGKTKPDMGKGHVEMSNLIGKINNLVSSDLRNLTSGCDFPILGMYSLATVMWCTDGYFLVLYIPITIGVAIWFLYTTLGWRWAARFFVLRFLT